MSKNMKLITDPQFIMAVRKYFLTTHLPVDTIAQELGTQGATIVEVFRNEFTPEEIRDRKSMVYAASKLGDKNPSFGKFGEDSLKYGGEPVADGNGYLMVLKPDWYTGRKGSRYIFQHTLVMCEAIGLTELPRGFVVHHIDRDRANNDPSNLALMTMAAHSKLHALERATTIPQGSRATARSARHLSQ